MFPGLGADLDRPAGTRPAGHRTGLLPLAWLLSQGPVNFALPPILQKPVIKTLAQTRALPCNPVLLTASDTMSQRYNISSTNRLCPTFTGSLTQDPRDEEIQRQCEKLCSGGGKKCWALGSRSNRHSHAQGTVVFGASCPSRGHAAGSG